MSVLKKIIGNNLEQRFVFVITAVATLSMLLLGFVVIEQVTTDTYVDVSQRTMFSMLLMDKVIFDKETSNPSKLPYLLTLLKHVNSTNIGREQMFVVTPEGKVKPESIKVTSTAVSYNKFVTDSSPVELILNGKKKLVWTLPLRGLDKRDNAGNPYRLGIAHSQDAIYERIEFIMYRMTLVAFIIIIFCYFVARSMATIVLTPLRNFMKLMGRVSKGEYPRENRPVEFQEMEEWTITFNSMVDQLREKNTLEKLLFEQEKMASIGHLSASIAHEIRNPLASISSLTQLLAERQKDDRKVQEYTSVILQESKRLNLAIEQLLAFARPIPTAFKHVNLDEVASSVVKLLNYEAEKLNVKLDLAPGGHENGNEGSTVHSVGSGDEYPVAGDINQLKQVLINLVRNAIQAQRSTGGEVLVNVCHSPENNMAEIIVSDTGPGITPDKAVKIFEPFFSTRKKGVGLGLSICKKIINGHGGTISFQNRTSRGGAIFSIAIPYDTSDGGGGTLSETRKAVPEEATPREIS